MSNSHDFKVIIIQLMKNDTCINIFTWLLTLSKIIDTYSRQKNWPLWGESCEVQHCNAIQNAMEATQPALREGEEERELRLLSSSE